ncbi:MAG: HDIG domain-containing protein [Firmicutes bacterium]|nr:HDIG domain-containing protein [Bacillota bacterium]
MAYWANFVNFLQKKFGENFFKTPAVRQGILGGIVFVTLVGILLANLVPERVDLQIGQVSKWDINSPRTIIDRTKTEQLQMEAARTAIQTVTQNRRNYVLSTAEAAAARDKVAAIFASIRGAQAAGQAGGGSDRNAAAIPVRNRTLTEDDLAALQGQIDQNFGVRVSRTSLRLATRADNDTLARVESTTASIVETVMLTERINETSLDHAKTRVDREVSVAEIPRGYAELVASIARGSLRTNMIPDPEKLRRAQDAAMRAVDPVRILKGQTVIRKGDIVTAEHVRVLKDLGMWRASVAYGMAAGVILISLILLIIMTVYLRQYNREILEDESLLALFGLVIIVIGFGAKIFSTLPLHGNGYLIPVAYGTILIALLLDARLAMLTTVALALFVGIVTGNDLRFVVVALVGGLVAVYSVSKISQRSDLVRAGVFAGLANFLTIAALAALQSEVPSILESVFGLVNGIVSSIFAIGSLPYLESLFGITSSIRLLELSNPNQPLLKRLLLEAPGTYHHSIIVGNLAEAAAEAVGADPLLVRVGAYYHDAGKVRRPYFFAENQLTWENPHDKIAPSLSTLIITSHVKDGVEMAREHNLPQPIVDIIQQHHGTDLVRYFYHRATEMDKEGTVLEQDFRYSGPRPQTKEAAVVMLADSVEAAVRAVSKPTPGRVEGLVRKIIKDRLAYGQLDECDLTLKDLDLIARAFVRVLSGIFHARVEYPENIIKEIEAKRGNNGGKPVTVARSGEVEVGNLNKQ